MVLRKFRQESLFAALLLFCRKSDDFCFYTKNYPVYRILNKYINVYAELEFLEIHYEGSIRE